MVLINTYIIFEDLFFRYLEWWPKKYCIKRHWKPFLLKKNILITDIRLCHFAVSSFVFLPLIYMSVIVFFTQLSLSYSHFYQKTFFFSKTNILISDIRLYHCAVSSFVFYLLYMSVIAFFTQLSLSYILLVFIKVTLCRSRFIDGV